MFPSPPDHWSLLVGPANWFRLYHPQSWQADEPEPGTFIFQSPLFQAMVAVKCVWLKSASRPERSHLESVVQKFPKVRNIKDVYDIQHPDLVECQQGEGLIGLPVVWWKAPFQKEDWRRWKIWVLQKEQLLIVITLLHAEDHDPELDSIVRMVVANVQVAETPAAPPDVFIEDALKLAREKFPLLLIKKTGTFSLQIDSARVNLSNLYMAYSRQPENFQKLVLPALTTAVQVQDWNENSQTPPLEVIRDRLMPMIFPEAAWKEKFPEMVGQQWVAGLVMLYVVDEANSYWYVSQELLTRLELTLDELHEISIANLNVHFEKNPMEITIATGESGVPSVIMPQRADSFNTTRLLSYEFLTKLRKVGQGNLVVGAPGRDIFIAVPMSQSELIQLVRKTVSEDYLQNEHPLTNRLLLVTPDGVSEFLD